MLKRLHVGDYFQLPAIDGNPGAVRVVTGVRGDMLRANADDGEPYMEIDTRLHLVRICVLYPGTNTHCWMNRTIDKFAWYGCFPIGIPECLKDSSTLFAYATDCSSRPKEFKSVYTAMTIARTRPIRTKIGVWLIQLGNKLAGKHARSIDPSQRW